MAVTRKTNYIPQPPTELIIPIEAFKNTIEKRIIIGEEILKREIKDQADFESNKELYNHWDDYNSEYLKQSFNNQHNEYKNSYDNCAMFVGFVKRSQTPRDKINNFNEGLNIKLSNLKKLQAKAELLK